MNTVGTMPEFQPGTIITLSDMTQLPALEDMVALSIDPYMTSLQKDMWDGRVNIKDMLRPPKFNGRIADIALEVMDNPYDRLLDCSERGWRFYGRAGHARAESNTDSIKDYIGLVLTAGALSTGRGMVGQIQAELWYAPVGRYKVGNYYQSNISNNGGTTILRKVTKPRLEAEKFIQLDEKAKRIGFEVLREQMKHPIKTHMRD